MAQLQLRPNWLGKIDYVSGVRAVEIERQEIAAQEALDLKIASHTIFGMEHPLTITLGKRADPLQDICVSVKILKERDVRIVAVDRGGQATLHNPGQLVIYPHLHLPTWGVGVRNFVNCLQLATHNFLNDFGVVSYTQPGEPGLYTERGKIAFFGLRIKNGWSSHGLAINVYNRVEDFKLIRPCGQKDQKICSLADWLDVRENPPELPQLFEKWCTHFEQILRYQNESFVNTSNLTGATAPLML